MGQKALFNRNSVKLLIRYFGRNCLALGLKYLVEYLCGAKCVSVQNMFIIRTGELSMIGSTLLLD